MSCAYNDNNTTIGLILGTGTNACYFENKYNIELLSELSDSTNNDNYFYSDAPEVKYIKFIKETGLLNCV
jgi:hexokinase